MPQTLRPYSTLRLAAGFRKDWQSFLCRAPILKAASLCKCHVAKLAARLKRELPNANRHL